jgi:uncharacterized protein involved in exopolysaccharide biosynthesis
LDLFFGKFSLVALVVALMLADVYLFTTPPLYSAYTKMMVGKERVQVFQQAILGDDPVKRMRSSSIWMA